jgi:hypothetical protein
MTGEIEQLGRTEFAEMELFIAQKSMLYLIQNKGSFHAMNTSVGKRRSAVRVQEPHEKTLAGAIIQDSLYTVEADGYLYANNLRTGENSSRGEPVFANMRYLAAWDGHLYGLERHGLLFDIDLLNGNKPSIVRHPIFKDAVAFASSNGNIYFVGHSGALKRYSLLSREVALIGSPVNGNVSHLTNEAGILYAMTNAGYLLKIEL